MARRTPDAAIRGIALAATLLAVAALPGCGDDDASDSTVPGTEAGQAGSEQSDADAGNITTFGEEASAEDRDAAGTAVQEFLRARADGDWGKACSLMSASTQDTLAGFGGVAAESQPCAKLIERVASQFPAKLLAAGEQTEVTGVRIDGDRGFVLYRDAGGESAFAIAREGTAWKVGAIAGYKLP